MDLDTPMSPAQFAKFIGAPSERWVRDRRYQLPGAINESREMLTFWPRAYLEARTNRTKPARTHTKPR